MTNETKKTPAFIAYFVPERENATWTRIGALWPHKDGKGFNFDQELTPAANAQGHVVFRAYEPKDETQG